MLLSGVVLFACGDSTTETSVEETTTEETAVTEENVGDAITGNSGELKIASAHLLLSPALFKAKLENDGEHILLDVRTPAELEENGSIEGARNLDYYAEDFKAQIDALDRDMPVMLYCRSGGRSGEAAAMMKEMGFSQVYDLNGGYTAWLGAGY